MELIHELYCLMRFKLNEEICVNANKPIMQLQHMVNFTVVLKCSMSFKLMVNTKEWFRYPQTPKKNEIDGILCCNLWPKRSFPNI